MEEKFRHIVISIEQVAKEEEAEQEQDVQEKLETLPIPSESIETVIEQLGERLKKEPKNRTLKKMKRQLEQDLLPRKKKYEAYKKC